MDAEAKGLTVEDLTLGQAPSPEALSDGPVVELWSCDDCRRSFLREETHS